MAAFLLSKLKYYYGLGDLHSSADSGYEAITRLLIMADEKDLEELERQLDVANRRIQTLLNRNQISA